MQDDVRFNEDPLITAGIMAEVVKHETGVDISPEAIVKLFEKRWATLSNLAHGIHRAVEARSVKKKGWINHGWTNQND